MTLPTIILELEHFTQLRESGFIEQSKVDIPEILQKRWSRSLFRDGELFQPKLNVLDDEYLLLDCPLKSGNLGYLLLNGLQLKYDMPLNKVQAVTVIHSHNLDVVSCSF